jgi:hypothetical protein
MARGRIFVYTTIMLKIRQKHNDMIKNRIVEVCKQLIEIGS